MASSFLGRCFLVLGRWIAGPVIRGEPPKPGSRVRCVAYMKLVPLGTLGTVERAVPPGRGVLVHWDHGFRTVNFGSELEIVAETVNP